MKQPQGIKRRTLVKGITASSLLPLLASNLVGCSDSSDRHRGKSIQSVPADFLHGVASGDPLSDRVILWTRVTPESEGDVLVEWDIASDENFDDIVGSGSGVTDAGIDYTVKVDAQGLDAGSSYFYRFRTGDKISPTGRTRTASVGSLAAASFAVVSCSNYPAGYFHVYREIAGQQVDAVLHLGDYLYEYDSEGYASDMADELERVSEPANELLSLEDYRTRYAQYHGDGDLQDCHAAHPFIIVWDDHEVADNAWQDGAENHDADSEGSYSERKAAAIQAWYEWLPVRPPQSEQEIIYRRFQFGDLVDLLMLDTRHVGRDEQVSYLDYYNGDMIDVDAARAAFGDSNRSLLGSFQKDWLMGALTDSTARWQVLGQQVMMGRIWLPEPLTRAFAPELLGSTPLEEAVDAAIAAVTAKNTPPEERTAEQQALLDSAIPWNPDLWDGYAYEREAIFNQAAQLQSRLVVLAGDSHNGWSSQLTTAGGDVVGVEFACASVSSPGAEDYIGEAAAGFMSGLVVDLIDDLKYANLTNRGYMLVSFTADQVSSEWRYVSSVKTRDYSLLDEAQHTGTVDRGDLLID